MNKTKKAIKVLRQNVSQASDLQESIEHILNEQSGMYAEFHINSLIMNWVVLEELLEEAEIKDILQNDKELSGLIGEVKSMIGLILNSELADCSQAYEQVIEYRKMLEQRVQLMVGYNELIESYEIVLDKTLKREQKQNAINKEELAGEILQFVFKHQEPVVINQLLKTILKAIPIRMTSQKFLDYIHDSLQVYYGAYESDLNQFITEMKETLEPQLDEQVVGIFEELSRALNIFKEMDYKDLSNSDVSESIMALQGLVNKIEQILDLCMSVMNLCNNLLGVILGEQNSAINISQELKNNAYKIATVFLDDQEVDFETSVYPNLEVFEGLQESVYEEIQELNIGVQLVAEKHSNMVAQLYKQPVLQWLDWSEKLSLGSLFVELETKENKELEQKQLDYEMLDKHITDFQEYLKAYLSTLSRPLKRAKMNQLLGLLPLPYKRPEDYYDLILNGLELCQEENEVEYLEDVFKDLLEAYL